MSVEVQGQLLRSSLSSKTSYPLNILNMAVRTKLASPFRQTTVRSSCEWADQIQSSTINAMIYRCSFCPEFTPSASPTVPSPASPRPASQSRSCCCCWFRPRARTFLKSCCRLLQIPRSRRTEVGKKRANAGVPAAGVAVILCVCPLVWLVLLLEHRALRILFLVSVLSGSMYLSAASTPLSRDLRVASFLFSKANRFPQQTTPGSSPLCVCGKGGGGGKTPLGNPRGGCPAFLSSF